ANKATRVRTPFLIVELGSHDDIPSANLAPNKIKTVLLTDITAQILRSEAHATEAFTASLLIRKKSRRAPAALKSVPKRQRLEGKLPDAVCETATTSKDFGRCQKQ